MQTGAVMNDKYYSNALLATSSRWIWAVGQICVQRVCWLIRCVQYFFSVSHTQEVLWKLCFCTFVIKTSTHKTSLTRCYACIQQLQILVGWESQCVKRLTETTTDSIMDRVNNDKTCIQYSRHVSLMTADSGERCVTVETHTHTFSMSSIDYYWANTQTLYPKRLFLF